MLAPSLLAWAYHRSLAMNPLRPAPGQGKLMPAGRSLPSAGRKATLERAFGASNDQLGSRHILPVSWRTADMKKILLGTVALMALGMRTGRSPAIRQDRIRQHVQRPDRRDRKRYAQFLRACARPSRPQNGWQAGGGDLRGRPAEARGGRAEVAEADRVRQGQFRGRLYLVERALGLAQAGGGFADLPDQLQCRAFADRRRAVLAVLLLDLLAERPDAAGDGHLHDPEGRQVGVPDRSQLCRRPGHAHRRTLDIQGSDRR